MARAVEAAGRERLLGALQLRVVLALACYRRPDSSPRA
jgi:hypothetical protein